jgi:hypothetical protein
MKKEKYLIFFAIINYDDFYLVKFNPDYTIRSYYNLTDYIATATILYCSESGNPDFIDKVFVNMCINHYNSEISDIICGCLEPGEYDDYFMKVRVEDIKSCKIMKLFKKNKSGNIIVREYNIDINPIKDINNIKQIIRDANINKIIENESI